MDKGSGRNLARSGVVKSLTPRKPINSLNLKERRLEVMDVEVISEGERRGREDVELCGGGERHQGFECLREKEIVGDDCDNVKPYVGKEFESGEAAKTFYDAYAKRGGFSIRVGWYSRSRPDGDIVSWEFSCSREVFKRKNVESCIAVMRVERRDLDCWVVTKFVEKHNHSNVSSSKIHSLRPRRHFAGAKKPVAENFDALSDMLISMDGHLVSCGPNHGASTTSGVEKPPNYVGPMNFVQTYSGRRNLGRRDAQNLLNYFRKKQAENPGFFYAIQLDDENHLTNVFWADARSRNAYSHFGDAVIFDTMYRPNQFLVPCTPFTGVNHHGQVVLFGCALLMVESESSFTWLFETWLSAMNNHPPVTITTDQDRVIQAAVNRVFPRSRHCICKWHILREGKERLSNIFLAHPSFYGELYSCINFSETIEDFESSWCSLIDKFGLQKLEWLQAVYNARSQWAPVYFRGTFFATLSSDQGLHSFFSGYVNQHTTISSFFTQYERALENSLERETLADYDTICSTLDLKTPSPMEQQAANLYSKMVFSKFQEELVETFIYTANKIEDDGVTSKFRVAKYEHDHKAYTVTWNVSEMNANCSCQMFEYSGILCRHILTVFTVTNVLTLPSHYILKRWTKNARVDNWSDEDDIDTIGMESLTMRFNSLCQEAIKVAEEGAIAAETYNTVLKVLKEVSKEVALTKKSIAKVSTLNSRSIVNNQEGNSKTPDLTANDILWPWQNATPTCYNINNSSVPVANLSHQGIDPMCNICESGTPDTLGVLTCFKSMSWVLEAKDPTALDKIAVINLKLQDYGNPPTESEVQFRLTRVSLEPMLKSMTYISQQLLTPANRVAVMSLKLQDTKTTKGETEVKFQVSKDALNSMLRSMVYIHEQL
ncbi:SWIM-type domain-containing protein [Heracleum sosnowskyi]|uniref:Protein FAR1-RELATED SEQUENCE n=1 Tax=Heracleum sosnowskyi TaxID=360622 RepID=A0AAD8MCE0_9APIA|nr:SWIM-type domain-containing protein [Heracleum sosnowskyi]